MWRNTTVCETSGSSAEDSGRCHAGVSHRHLHKRTEKSRGVPAAAVSQCLKWKLVASKGDTSETVVSGSCSYSDCSVS